MRKKYDWLLLKDEFVRGGWLNLSVFCQERGIKYNAYARGKMTGWLETRKQYQDEIVTRTQQQVLEDEVTVKLRHQKLAQEMQLKGAGELYRLPVKSAREARKLLITGLEQERSILGLNEPKTAVQAALVAQEAVTDSVLGSLSFNELIQLVTELNKFKQAKKSAVISE